MATKKKRCEAKTRTTGTPCKRYPMSNGRCYLHGGKSLAGPAHPGWKHGKYSKYFRGDNQKRYDSLLNNPDILSLREEIALIELRISELLDKDEEGDSVKIWSDLDKEYKKLLTSIRRNDVTAQTRSLGVMGGLIERANGYNDRWDEVVTLAEQKSRLVEREQRLEVHAGTTVVYDVVLAMLSAVIAATKESAFKHADRETARKIIIDSSDAYKRIVSSTAV